MPLTSQQLLEKVRALFLAGQLEQAAEIFPRLVQANPQHVPALQGLALIACQIGDHTTALELINQAIALEPLDAELFANRAAIETQAGQYLPALVSYEIAIALAPGNADNYYNRGCLHHEQKHYEAALADYGKAIELEPRHAKAYGNRGATNKMLERYEAGLADIEKAIAINPADACHHNNRAVIMMHFFRFEEALASCDKAIELDPLFLEARTTRSLASNCLGRISAALEDLDHALALNPDKADLQFYKALALLRCGDFTQGWPLYEWRWKCEHGPLARDFSSPCWEGTAPLSGKTILLHAEQGLGDTLQFCRYVGKVAALGASVLLEVPAPLMDLLKNLEGIDRLLLQGAPLPPFDYHCPLMSLPLAFKTTLQSIPTDIPYIRADEEKVAYWRERLGEKKRPRVGLVWNGGVREHREDQKEVNRKRNLYFSQFARLNLPEIDFFSLQKGEPGESEVLALRTQYWPDDNFHNFTAELYDFSDTAALVANLDLVISVDTSVAHLAGAMGKPVWMLNRLDSCWRWLQNRDDSPWYPTLKLYQQRLPGEWDGVIEQFRVDLALMFVDQRNSSRWLHEDLLDQRPALPELIDCPVCQTPSPVLDTLDLNRASIALPSADIAIAYHLCPACGFCFAPEMCAWAPETFAKHIYNADYALLDPDYLSVRPKGNVDLLSSLFGKNRAAIRHLDYGSGQGLLSRLLQQEDWNSSAYDPFDGQARDLAALGRYNLITAVEVFEHVPDVHALMTSLLSLLDEPGVILFSTVLSDGNIRAGSRIDWGYAAPRNGHISLFSSHSLRYLAQDYGLSCKSLSDGLHAFWKKPPAWFEP